MLFRSYSCEFEYFRMFHFVKLFTEYLEKTILFLLNRSKIFKNPIPILLKEIRIFLKLDIPFYCLLGI